jgi:hypothetical protein
MIFKQSILHACSCNTRHTAYPRSPRAGCRRASLRNYFTLAQAPSASGEFPVILFAVSVASAYVVTPGRDYPAHDSSQPQRWGFSKFYSHDPSRSVALMPRRAAPLPSARRHCPPLLQRLCDVCFCGAGRRR